MPLSEGNEKSIELDDKTQAMLTAKGYRIDNFLGAGSFAKVYKGLRTAKNEVCAVKVMFLDKMNDKYKQKFLPRELATLQEIHHENIIHVWDIFKANKRIYVFMEFAANGDLQQYLKQAGQALTEEKARVWFVQTCHAVQYLHEELFTAHRDIKIDNILLSDKWVAKLADFGFASTSVSPEGQVVLSKTFCGTAAYESPQIINQQQYDPFKADVWAMGVVLYVITHFQYPYQFQDRRVMAQQQKSYLYLKLRINLTKSINLRRLIKRMLYYEEEKRFTISEVLDHLWAKN